MGEERLRKIENMVEFLIRRVLRLEKKLKCSDVCEGSLYGAINNIDIHALGLIDENKISKDKIQTMREILTPIYNDAKRLKQFKGYYDIEHEIEKRGISRGEARVILKYFRGDGNFKELIDKMKGPDSPTEMTSLEVTDNDF